MFLRAIFIWAWVCIVPSVFSEEANTSSDMPAESSSEASNGVNRNGFCVRKVNYDLLDKEGYPTAEVGNMREKAVYQKKLRSGKELADALRFHVFWEVPSEGADDFIVKVEARGVHSVTDEETYATMTKKYPAIESRSGWADLTIKPVDYKFFGDLMAWKVTLLCGDEIVATRHSFTWSDESPKFPKNRMRSKN